MALQRDYEIPGTGVVVRNAYHVITKISIEKRTNDIQTPEDRSREDGRTAGNQTPGDEINWKAGYIAIIAITVWKDEQARTNDAKPIGFVGVNPTDNTYGINIGTDENSHICKFFLDVNSEDSDLVQGYKHLKTTPYYQNAVEV